MKLAISFLLFCLSAVLNVAVAKTQGAGVAVTRYWKTGSVDYKKIPELKGVNLEKFRGKLREEVRVTAG